MKQKKVLALFLVFVMVFAAFISPLVTAEGEDAEAEAEEVTEEVTEEAASEEDATTEEAVEGEEAAEGEEATEEDATTEATEEAEERINYEDPFIADREITIQVFVDDIAADWPENFAETEVGKVLKERTGVDLSIVYQAADSDLSLLNQLIMSDSITTDAILAYLNNSARPEFPVLLKGAQEGLFADLSEILPETLVYSKYAEEDYLPNDSYKNIVYRDEFDGAVYMLHLGVPRYDESTTFDPNEDMVGGMYIQQTIADELGIDPREVRTADDFYNLLVSIRDGGFTDQDGQPVTPLGPKYWGGSNDAMDYFLRPFNWGVSDGYNVTEDGEILHEVETEYAQQKVDYTRRLLAENLIHPEFFTMDSTSAEEVTRNLSVAIIGDVHNYVDVIYDNDNWLPLGPLDDYTGDNSNTAGGKGGYGVLAINSYAENPAEIMKFFDYLSTYEGKLLGNYGVEGVSYEFDEEGNPRLTEEAHAALNEGNKDYMVQTIGAGFGGAGNYFFNFASTDGAGKQEFGETRPGASSAEMFEGAIRVAEFSPRTYRYVPGLSATAYLNDPAMEQVKVQMSLLNYRDQLVAAFYAPSEEDAAAILENFKNQLDASGLAEFKAHLDGVYAEDPESINFY